MGTVRMVESVIPVLGAGTTIKLVTIERDMIMTNQKLYKLYLPVKPESGILEMALRNLTWVAGGMSASPIIGNWHDSENGMNLVIEDVQRREYYIESGAQEVAFKHGLDEVIAELHRLGEKSVLWTISSEEVHYD
jgi:hypothetical protein